MIEGLVPGLSTTLPDWDAIRDENRALEIGSAAPLGEGWTATTFLVNEALVFKFPKRADDWEELEIEIAFLARARARLPLPTAEHLFQVRRSAGALHGYAVYRHLRGDPPSLSSLAGAARATLAASLAEFMLALHGMVSDTELTSTLRHDDERSAAERSFRDALQQIGPALTGIERQRLIAVFSEHLDDPGNFPARPGVIHADLSANHILCAGGSISGVLDWGDVNVGDPDYDFSYLYADCGEAFVRDVALQYGHQDVDRLVRKARYFRIADQIDTIVHGGERALPHDRTAAWRRLHALLGGADATD